jgi:hypothetical protein
MGVLPKVESVASWIPVDDAARAITELTFFRRANGPSSAYRHIVHPAPLLWNDVFSHVVSHLERLYSKTFQLVSYDEWLEKLRDAASLAERDGSIEAASLANPAIKLLETTFDGLSCAELAEMAGSEGASAVDSIGIRRLRTSKTESESEAMRSAGPLVQSDVDSWIDGWVREGFLGPPAAADTSLGLKEKAHPTAPSLVMAN